jgi:hypothetical protein
MPISTSKEVPVFVVRPVGEVKGSFDRIGVVWKQPVAGVAASEKIHGIAAH